LPDTACEGEFKRQEGTSIMSIQHREEQVTVRPAEATDLHRVAQLFDLYRQFYKQPTDLPLAEKFISERFANRESVILVASTSTPAIVGFTQLYATFCSVSAGPIYVLYDLFVEEASRRHGVARTLMTASYDYARQTGAIRLELSTAITNVKAQALYESLGWVRDVEFYRYSLAIDG
jgi:ribosomal protein S18 acetylase RimI-like enzyme